jgi:hypothetical protein
LGDAGDGVAAIGGLNEGVAKVLFFSADGFGPLEVTLGIQLDDIDILNLLRRRRRCEPAMA